MCCSRWILLCFELLVELLERSLKATSNVIKGSHSLSTWVVLLRAACADPLLVPAPVRRRAARLTQCISTSRAWRQTSVAGCRCKGCNCDRCPRINKLKRVYFILHHAMRVHPVYC